MRKFSMLLLIAVTALFLGAQERQSKLAVMEIDDQSGKLSKKLLETAAEALRTELVASNKFIVISKDRQRKAMIKGEKKESWKECYDQSCRIQLGQALTADNIMTGIVTYFGKKYTLTVEIIDLAKEATVKGSKAEFDGTEEGLADAIKSIAAQVTGVEITEYEKPPLGKDEKACTFARERNDLEVWRDYLKDFSKGDCVFEAKSRVKELKKQKEQEEKEEKFRAASEAKSQKEEEKSEKRKAISTSNTVAHSTTNNISMKDAKDLSRKGWKSLNDGDGDAAIELFLMAIKIDPLHGDAYYGLGSAYQMKGLNNEAKEYYEKALQSRLRSDDRADIETLLNNLSISPY